MRKFRLFQKNAYISIDFGNQSVEVFRIVDGEDDQINIVPATMLGMIDAGIDSKKIIFEKPVVQKINAIQEEQKAFISAIRGFETRTANAEEAAEALRIAELIQEQINHP